MSKQHIVEAIKKYKTFLISSHINPEGDAIGSQLALASLLKRLHKKVYILNDDASRQFGFLSKKGMILHGSNKKLRFDAAVVLDCPLLSRVGTVERFIQTAKILLNIDHHISNEYFGTTNWVDPHASCVGELIYELFDALGVSLTRREALNIYVAILTDTGSFRYSNTTSKTHYIVSELLKHNIKPHIIFEKVYGNTTLSYITFLNKILSTLKKEGKIAYIALDEDLTKLGGNLTERLEDFINYPRALKGVKVAMLFRKIGKNRVKVSFRSKGDFDVNSLAKKFGGGGHPAASGCVLEGTIDEARKKVLVITKTLLSRTQSACGKRAGFRPALLSRTQSACGKRAGFRPADGKPKRKVARA
ncbi:MAG: bifunctional oligoribonuclease/PAP phosphatase NrnA [Candidatus Omnitrophota bacterium]